MAAFNLGRGRLAGALVLLGVGALAALGPFSAFAQVNNGYFVLQNNCKGCHPLSITDPEIKKRPRKEWDKILTRMIKERGASLNKREYALLLDYLDSFNYLPKEINWVTGPARSHQVTFSAKQMPQVPQPLVAQTSGTGKVTPWIMGQDLKAKSLFVAPSRPAKDGQYPMLIDNSGMVKDGAVSVKMRIDAGKGRLGAGLVIGYLGPSSYFGVRISPTSNDLVLYRVTPDARSLLARVRLKVDVDAWHTLAIQVKGGEATVTFNGQKMAQMSRPLPNYRAGHVGFGTQGVTMAQFDGWSVQVSP